MLRADDRQDRGGTTKDYALGRVGDLIWVRENEIKEILERSLSSAGDLRIKAVTPGGVSLIGASPTIVTLRTFAADFRPPFDASTAN